MNSKSFLITFLVFSCMALSVSSDSAQKVNKTTKDKNEQTGSNVTTPIQFLGLNWDMSCVEIIKKRRLKETFDRCQNKEVHLFEKKQSNQSLLDDGIEYTFVNNRLKDIMIMFFSRETKDYAPMVNVYTQLYGSPYEVQIKWKNPETKLDITYKEIKKYEYKIKSFSTIWHFNDDSGLDLYWSQLGISIFIYSPDEWKRQLKKGNYQRIYGK
ncbi:MAG: hypothetical protein JW737_06950 [Acidobacteria bacterium]|nr:hypothetical protein [Acidobacteriota bacterium]